MRNSVASFLGAMFLMTMICAQNTMAQNYVIVLYHEDCTTTEVALNTNLRISFEGNMMYITSPFIETQYIIGDVVRMSYKGYGTSIDYRKKEIEYVFGDNQIILNNIKNVDCLDVYRSNGIKIASHISYANGKAIISLASLSSGIYLFRINGKTVKYVKK